MESTTKFLYNRYPQVPASIANAMYATRYLYPIGGTDHQVDSRIRAILKKKALYLTTKQVPSCTLLRGVGSGSVYRNRSDLFDAGFGIEEVTPTGWVNVHPDGDLREGDYLSAGQISTLNSIMTSIKEENASLFPEEESGAFEHSMAQVTELRRSMTPGDFSESDDSDESEYESSDEPAESAPFKKMMRIRYEDAFLINASLVYAAEVGMPTPKVHVWEGDVLRLSDVIPSRFLGPDWDGSRKTGVPFYAIRNANVLMYVVFRRTYWGKLLSRLARESCDEQLWARRLKKRIIFFLRGFHDPRWNKTEITERYGRRDYTPRMPQSRAVRFLQLLMTVDGIFQQRYLAFPNEEWTWHKFDRFILGNISMLIGDEFLDGDIIRESDVESKLAYTELKDVRKQFKELANSRRLNELIGATNDRVNPMLECFRGTYLEYLKIKDPDTELRVRGILSQSRGAGTPPPIVALQAKIKLIKTLTAQPTPLSNFERSLLVKVFGKLVSEYPDSFFTGLKTKAGVRAATSSCYEKTRREGGSAQAIQEIVYDGILGRPCRIIDLNTGELESIQQLKDCTPGEYIFWRCLEEVLGTDPQELSKVFLLVVSEPGKARSVTKGAVALKVVLDTINGICSWPLTKVTSSSSGMGKETHGWNFFRMFETEHLGKMAFDPEEIRTEAIDPKTKFVSEVYRDMFVLSTDYTTATDFMQHDVAEIVGTIWMRKCGIPRVLEGIVRRTCYKPRIVLFTAKGVVRKYGEKVDDDTNRITMSRGVLMGDPLTKVVLHLVNIGSRYLAWKSAEKGWLSDLGLPGEFIRSTVLPEARMKDPCRRASS